MKSTSAVLEELYPIVKKTMDANINKYKKVIGNFVERRSSELYAIAPYTRIYFGSSDEQEMYQALDVNPKTIKEILTKTYYWSIPRLNPAAAKDEFTIMILTIVRYFFMNKMEKELDMAITYLAFSGKFYPSIHYGSFPKVQPSEYPHIMNYVINNMLSEKYDIRKYGSVIGAIRSICKTWITSYEDKIKEYSDEDIKDLIQQLHTRIKSFMKNIAAMYYKAYEDKDKYMTYDNDNLSDDNYHLADSDSYKAERIIEQTINYINSTSTNMSICKAASDGNVRVDEVRAIIDTILSDTTNMADVKELIRLIVYTYFAQSSTKDIQDVSFITFTIAPKPNSKNKDILRQKEIVENWLETNSAGYRKRKGRLSTKNSYNRAIFMYFTLVIVIANK